MHHITVSCDSSSSSRISCEQLMPSRVSTRSVAQTQTCANCRCWTSLAMSRTSELAFGMSGVTSLSCCCMRCTAVTRSVTIGAWADEWRRSCRRPSQAFLASVLAAKKRSSVRWGDFLGGDSREPVGAWISALHDALLGRLAVARSSVLGASPSYAEEGRSLDEHATRRILESPPPTRRSSHDPEPSRAPRRPRRRRAHRHDRHGRGSPVSAAPSKKNVTLTVTVLPGQVRLMPGESVKVRLTTNLTTGYSGRPRSPATSQP